MSLYNDALVHDIARLLRKSKPVTTTIDDRKVKQKVNIVPPELAAAYQDHGSRHDKVRKSRAMYDGDPRFEGIVTTLARDATKGGFQLEFTEEDSTTKQAADLAEDLRVRLGIDKRLDDWVRLTLRDGDSFFVLGVSSARRIDDVIRKNPLKMYRNTDEDDRFKDPTLAFWYANMPSIMPPKSADWYAEWEVIHARWSHDEGNKYGRPLMASGHDVYKRVSRGELDVAVRRRTRSSIRYHHRIEGDETEVERYMELNKAAIEKPTAPVSDFFGNGDISVLQGDGNLGDIDDIIHHIETWWLGSPVPRGLLGYGRDLNRDVLENQKSQYDETLPNVRDWVGNQIVLPLLHIEWLLHGIVPDLIRPKITWVEKKVVTAEEILKIAKAIVVLRNIGIPSTILSVVLARFLPGIDAATLLDAMDDDPFMQGDADRLATIALSLAQKLGTPEGSEEDEPEEEPDEG